MLGKGRGWGKARPAARWSLHPLEWRVKLFRETRAETQKTQNQAGLERKSSAEHRREKAKR